MTQQTLARAVQHHRAEELVIAEQYYREILVREPPHPDALHLLGVIAHRRGQYHDAIDLINPALKKNSRDIRFHIHLSHTYRQANRLQKKIQTLRKALKVVRNNWIGCLNTGGAPGARKIDI